MKLKNNDIKKVIKEYLKKILNEAPTVQDAFNDLDSTPQSETSKVAELLMSQGITDPTPEQSAAALAQVRASNAGTAAQVRASNAGTAAPVITPPAEVPVTPPAEVPVTPPAEVPVTSPPAESQPAPKSQPSPVAAKPKPKKLSPQAKGIIALQKELVKLNVLPPSGVDGVYGRQTNAALVAARQRFYQVASSMYPNDPAKSQIISTIEQTLQPAGNSPAQVAELFKQLRTLTGNTIKGNRVTDKKGLMQKVNVAPNLSGKKTKNMGIAPGTKEYNTLTNQLNPGNEGYGVYREGKVIFPKSYIQQVIREELQRVLKKKLKK